MGANPTTKPIRAMTVVDVQLPHCSAAGTRRACYRSRVSLLQLVSDASKAVVARAAIAFYVRIARIFVSVVHAVTEDPIALINYHSTFFA